MQLRYNKWLLEDVESSRNKEKTTFCTSEVLYEFTLIPFGLCNGQATFQRLMKLMLARILWSSCLAYRDDIIVLGNNIQDHLKRLSQVFQKLRDANLKSIAKYRNPLYVRN